MTARLRVALVGAGSMGSHHARIIAESDRAELGVIIDTNESLANRLAAAHGVAGSADLGAARACDAAVVATSTESHPAIAMALVDWGLPVLVEKPLADQYSLVERMVDRAVSAGVPMMCGFVERFNPVVRTARELLEGPVVHVVAVRHSPAAAQARSSVLWDLLIHDLDIATQLSGGSSVSMVTGASVVPPGGHEQELFDAIVRFDSGLIAALSASRLSHRKVRQMSIETGELLIELDLVRQDITVWRHLSDEMVAGRAITYRANTTFDIPFVRAPVEPLGAQFSHFLGLIDGSIDAGNEYASLLQPHLIADALFAAERLRVPATVG